MRNLNKTSANWQSSLLPICKKCIYKHLSILISLICQRCLLHLIQTRYLSMSGFKQSTLIISNICLDLRQFFAKNSFYHYIIYSRKSNNSWLEMPHFVSRKSILSNKRWYTRVFPLSYKMSKNKLCNKNFYQQYNM